MLISDNIARLIEKMLDDGGGFAELKRNELAITLGCVPSQINYVITSRFTPEQGYIVESRRGGGGYIKIVRVKLSENEYLMHFFHAIGNSVDESEARAYIVNLRDHGIVSDAASRVISASISLATSHTRAATLLRAFKVIWGVMAVVRNSVRSQVARPVRLSP